MFKTSILFLFILTLSSDSNKHLDMYSAEISELKNNSEIDTYWKMLYNIDQTILMETKDPFSRDSISITNMMRTALLFEIHEPKVYTMNNSVPILNLTHNYFGDSNLAFWPIIQECKKIGGTIQNFGGGYPGYQLEGISMSFYDYSLFNKDSDYPHLLNKLNSKTYRKVSTELSKILNNQKKLAELKETKILGQWKRQQFIGTEDNGSFEFVVMSDDNLYLRRSHRLHKLIEISSTKSIKKYRIDNEPFGWTYTLVHENLRLIDDQNKTLIIYNSFN